MIYICELCRKEVNQVYIDLYTGVQMCSDCYFDADDDEEEDDDDDL